MKGYSTYVSAYNVDEYIAQLHPTVFERLYNIFIYLEEYIFETYF